MTPVEHAKACQPAESAGFFVGDEYVPCTNVADDPVNNFRIAPSEWRPDADAIVHSHPDGYPWLSTADRVQQHRTGLDWYLVVGDELKHFRYAPLLRGRQFDYGRFDCYTIVRDAYMLCGIELIDYQRKGMREEIADNAFVVSMPKTGFYEVEDGIQPGDVVLSNVAGVANHAGVYLGDERILHHPARQLSRVEQLGGFWHKSIHSIWRHEQWDKSMIEAIENDVKEII
ncbi:C40 family peptidase [Cardiobacteriaceae bacterium TAE3-ERU3]|nr:C40 family peptidase [Cardiobacteriaceae bacterium TAE3-ERU3]